MMLHLGVVDIPYAEAPSEFAPAKPVKGTETTGDVATILEEKYHVIETFYETHEQAVADALTSGLAGEIENLLMGSGPRDDAFAGGTSAVDDMFRRFLFTREAEESGIPGTPTKAAIRGVDHRLKSGRGPRRPSFIDTGLYENSFKSWVE